MTGVGECLREDLLHYTAAHVREPELASLEEVSQLLVIDSQQVQDGRLQVVDVDAAFDDVESVVVGAAVDVSRA